MPKQEIDGDQLFNLSLSVMGLVLKSGYVSIAELARHFEVSEKTIVKAVRAIAFSEDAVRFESHFDLDWDAFEDGEVGLTQYQGNLSTPPVLSKRQASALAAGVEYLASLPQFQGDRELDALRSLFAGSVTPVSTAAEPHGQKLEQLRNQISEGRAVELDYLNQLGERSSRVVDPLRLDFVGAKHYLRGYCHSSAELRSFRVDRIVELVSLEQPALKSSLELEIPDEVYGHSPGSFVVSVVAEPEAGELFWNFPVTAEPRLIEGQLHGEIVVGNLRALGRHVARYGGKAKVVSPPEAVVAVRDYVLGIIGELGE